MSTPHTAPPRRLQLTIEEEPTDAYVQFTTSGAFQVGDFFRIDEDGYTLKENGHAAARTHTTRRPSPTEQGRADATRAAHTDESPTGGASASASVASSHSSVASPAAASSSATQPRGGTSSAIGSAATAAATVNVTSLADLVVLNPIGQGASGLVQRVALRSNPSVHLALKVVPLDLSEAKSKQILIELRTLHFAAHENIVNFYGAFYKERSMSLVLEYMDRGSLSDCLKRIRNDKIKQQKKRRERRRRQEQQRQQAADPSLAAPATLPSPNSPILSTPLVEEKYISCVARQLLSGLHYLHATRRLIHRDIKPSNILLSSSGAAKLADFGVSGELQEAAENQNKISFVGTVTFMSPERIQGHPHSFDSDLWSLGLTLAEMTLGYFPYAKPGDQMDELSSDDDQASADTMSDHEEDEKDGQRAKHVVRVHSLHSHGDSPSSSAASTPSHASISIVSPTTSSSLGEFMLAGGTAGKFGKEHDLYNATQTHAPGGFALPPLGSPSHARDSGERPNFLSVAALKRTNSSLQAHQPGTSSSAHSPTLRSTSATGDQLAAGSGSHTTNGGSGSGQKEKKPAATAAKSKSFGFWDIMQRIVQGSAPVLPSRISRKTGREKYSAEFRSFLESCLKKDPKERPTALELLQHPFITKHADITLDEWMKTIPEPDPKPARAPAAVAHSASLTPSSLRPGRPPSGTMIASPSSIIGTPPIASPHPSATLPPLPHRRWHHSTSESPRAGGLTVGVTLAPPMASAPTDASSSAMEESEIETFPVTPSVPGFANAYESFPIMADEVTPMAEDRSEIPLGDAATSSIATSSSGGTASRLKRKPTTDISVDIDDGDSISLAPQLDSTTSQQSATSASTAAPQGTFPHASFGAHALLVHVGSAPSSTRSDTLAVRSAFPMVSTSHSASASPPSSAGRVRGATPLKRLKSAPSPDASSSSPPRVGRPDFDGPMVSPASASLAGPSASALFAANLKLIKAQRAESLTQLEQPNMLAQARHYTHTAGTSSTSGSAPAGPARAGADQMADVHPATALAAHAPATCLPPAGGDVLTGSVSGSVASLLSPFTPATASKLTRFTLHKDAP